MEDDTGHSPFVQKTTCFKFGEKINGAANLSGNVLLVLSPAIPFACITGTSL